MNNWCICWFFMHPLNAELNSICHLLALLGGATIVVISRLRVKGSMKNQQIHQLFIQFINYVCQLLHVLALHCHLQGAFVVPSERFSIEEQSIEYCRWACCV